MPKNRKLDTSLWEQAPLVFSIRFIAGIHPYIELVTVQFVDDRGTDELSGSKEGVLVVRSDKIPSTYTITSRIQLWLFHRIAANTLP